MLNWMTAGESHGPSLVAMIDGFPAGVEITHEALRDALARRRLGYGRGARQKFEQDEHSFGRAARSNARFTDRRGN